MPVLLRLRAPFGLPLALALLGDRIFGRVNEALGNLR